MYVVLTVFNDPTAKDLTHLLLTFEKDFNIMALFTLTISMGIAVTGMLCFHTYLLLTNNSTIEIDLLRYDNVFDNGRN